MGAFSELDYDRECGGSRLTEGTPPPTPTGQQAPAWADPAEAAPAALEDVGHKPVEPAPQDASDISKSGENTADDTDEDAKRRAHEAAEAQRKADWEAKQRQKKAAIQEHLARLAAMSDDEVAMASMKRVSADTEKLTRRNMKDCVSEHIQTLCLDDPAFARRVGHPGKSMVNCFRYINRKAWDYIQDELKASGIQPGPGPEMYGADVPDGLCYQWAVDYFKDPDAKEDQAEEETFVPRPYIGKTAKAKGGGKPKSKTKKEATPKPTGPQKAEPKKAVDASQLAMGEFMMPEEAAG